MARTTRLFPGFPRFPRIRGFLRSQTGAITSEAVIVLPTVIWAVMATFVFFDAFRVKTFSQKAAYTVADALSRQTDPVDEDYIRGINRLHDILARTRNPTAMRVSSIGRHPSGEGYEVIWSVPPEGRAALTSTFVNTTLSDGLPDFPPGDTIIYVETQIDYLPLFRVGLPFMNFRQAVSTRPRFAPQIPFDDGTTILAQDLSGSPSCDDGDELCG
jgi:hypothetical protein